MNEPAQQALPGQDAAISNALSLLTAEVWAVLGLMLVGMAAGMAVVGLTRLFLPSVDGDGLGDPQKSCITPGTYECVWHTSPKYGECYEVTGVVGRSHILIHPANWAHQLLGCIALGKGRGVLNGKPAITQSRDAIKEFHNHMAQQNFTLQISWA